MLTLLAQDAEFNISISALQTLVAALQTTDGSILSALSLLETSVAAHDAAIILLQGNVSSLLSNVATLLANDGSQDTLISILQGLVTAHSASISSVIAVNAAQNTTLASHSAAIASIIAVNADQNASIIALQANDVIQDGAIMSLQAADVVIFAFIDALNFSGGGDVNFTSLLTLVSGIKTNVTVLQDLTYLLPVINGGTGNNAVPGNGTVAFGDGSGIYSPYLLFAGDNLVLTRGANNLSYGLSPTPAVTSIGVSGLTPNAFVYAATGGAGTLTSASVLTGGQVYLGRDGGLPPVPGSITVGPGLVQTLGSGFLGLNLSDTISVTNLYVMGAATDTFLYINPATGLLTGAPTLGNGELYIGRQGSLPARGNITAGAGIALTLGNGSLMINASSTQTFTTLTVTGLAQNGLVSVGTGGLLLSTVATLDGQIPIAVAGGAFVWNRLTQGPNIVIGNTAGNVNVSLDPNPVVTTLAATAASSQILLGSGGTATTLTTSPSGPRLISIPDSGTTSSTPVLLANTASAQTVAATTHFQALGYVASATSSTYFTGTVGSNGAGSRLIVGSGTSFVPAMTGGEITFANGVTRFVVAVVNTTVLFVDQASTITAGSSYMLKYNILQSANGYLGFQGGSMGPVVTSPFSPQRLNIFGTQNSNDDSAAAFNVYTDASAYAIFQFLGSNTGATEMCADCQWAGISPWVNTPNYISGNVNGNMLLRFNGNDGFRLYSQAAVAAGSVISSWNERMRISSAGDVSLIPSAGVRPHPPSPPLRSMNTGKLPKFPPTFVDPPRTFNAMTGADPGVVEPAQVWERRLAHGNYGDGRHGLYVDRAVDRGECRVSHERRHADGERHDQLCLARLRGVIVLDTI